MTDQVREYSATAQLHVIRIIMSLMLIMNFRICIIDIKWTYLQSGAIRRRIYVGPPPDVMGTRGMLWILTSLQYGIKDTGRKWKKAIEGWIIDIKGLESEFGVSQLIIKCNCYRKATMIVAKFTEDILRGDRTAQKWEYAEKLKEVFLHEIIYHRRRSPF